MHADPALFPQILMVDDEPYVLEVLKRMLAPRFTVVTASDGEQALRALAEPGNVLRVVLLDLTMPGLAGAPLLRRLRAEHPRVRVCIMSGLTPDAAAPLLAGCEPDGFVSKPLRQAVLLEWAERELGASL